LDRQSIERRDFPIARRGYDIEAVDAHLAMVADEVETVLRRGRPATGGGSLAASASEQVRAIIEAAEQSAADIGREAELEARQARQDAREEAERLRGEAGRQAREHVTRVAEVARGLLDRIEAMDRELATMLEGLRSGTQRVSADLSLLQGSVEEVRDTPPGPGSAGPAERGAATSAPLPAPATVAEPEPERGSPAEPGPQPAGEPDAEAAPGEHDGARMVALNMALNGVAREETERHLEQNFDVEDVARLLDDVYARAGQ
jgi:DivIVA domain-containing protein